MSDGLLRLAAMVDSLPTTRWRAEKEYYIRLAMRGQASYIEADAEHPRWTWHVCHIEPTERARWRLPARAVAVRVGCYRGVVAPVWGPARLIDAKGAEVSWAGEEGR